MATVRQIEANRLNALQSTGPRTPEGKSRASLNAITHGLFSKRLLTSDENPALLEIFAVALRADLAPAGVVEELLVEQIIATTWRLRRLGCVESGAWEAGAVSNFHGGVVAFNAEIAPKLARYYATIERSFYRALHELQRLQAARAGREVLLPLSVEIDVEVSEES